MHILAISQGREIEASKWAAVVKSGIDALMIREKHLNAQSLLDLGRQILDMAPALPLWINGRLDVALALGVGFHGPEDYPEIPPRLCAVSRPLHNIAQIRERQHSDQLLVSPVFAVPGKGEPLGVPGLYGILDNLPPWRRTVLALGGINPENAAILQHNRLDGVALIRSLWDSKNPRNVVDKLRSAWKDDKC
ncbi:MAG: thiamine phosphate synthase [Holophagales bacterium]|jgi:thiamine monophosphate synthase|nr:thiamine phosphate synthase [Holophagales bacterium]